MVRVFKYDFCLVVKILFTKEKSNEDGNMCCIILCEFLY